MTVTTIPEAVRDGAFRMCRARGEVQEANEAYRALADAIPEGADVRMVRLVVLATIAEGGTLTQAISNGRMAAGIGEA